MSRLRKENIEACLLGTAVGDACGALLEGVFRADLHDQFASPQAVLDHAYSRQLQYTDDTQMTLALADYLTRHERIESESLMSAFVDAYQSWRGYGRGTTALIDAYRYKSDWNFLAQTLFPGGSLGNGAAMRSAPVGLRFFADHETIWQQAAASAHPTHRHELGIEAAQLIAMATSLAIEMPEIDPANLAAALRPWCKTTVFGKRIDVLAGIQSWDDVAQLGNGIEAHESVVTAIACFALSPDDYPTAIGQAIWQAGDTDTIAAMTGAMCGARLGGDCIPSQALANLEDDGFADHVAELAARLFSNVSDRDRSDGN